jgi:hypothetical protein
MRRSTEIDVILSVFDREVKKSKTKAQRELVFDIAKLKIDRCQGDDRDKTIATAYMAMQKELNL